MATVLFQSMRTSFFCSSQRALQTLIHTVTWPFKWSNSLIGSLIDWAVLQAKTTAQKLFVTVLTFLIMLWMSVFSYASFYHLYIPSAEILKPVHLGFSVCPEGSGICSFPSANVSFGRSSHNEEILSSGQKYRVVVELEMPDCPMNQELGMFMVVMRMYDRHHYVSAESRRSVMTKYRSFPLRVLDMMVWSPLYFFGFTEETKFLSVEMFSAFVDDYYHPSVGATVEIQSHKIQFYSVQLKLYANFTGLKYILHYWPITSSFFGIWWNMFLCAIYIAFTIYKRKTTFELLSQSLNFVNDEDEDHEVVDDLSVSSDEADSSETNLERSSQSTQTKENNNDDAETYDIPLVQEPADFVGDNVELMAELRHRRVH